MASGAETKTARIPLEALNFFMADMQAGVGPFLGVFLSQHGWRTGAIGTVMTLGGVAGVLVMAPAGAIVDQTRRKRTCVILSGLFTVLASALIWISQSFWVIAGSQVATAIAGAAIGPAVVGITLGIVRQSGFNQQNGRNQAFNHGGNMVGAGLSGLLGWKFGLPAAWTTGPRRARRKGSAFCSPPNRFWCWRRAWRCSTWETADCCLSMDSRSCKPTGAIRPAPSP